jgi:hypothetical protein
MMFTNRYESPTPPQKNLPHQPPRLGFFISRNNGNIVPLIPADELPYSVRLSGVQRSMRMENTCGMQHVGNLPFTGQYFRLEADTLQQAINTNANHHKSNSVISAKQFLAPDAMIRQNTGETTPSPATSLSAGDQTAVRQLPASTTATTWRRQADAMSAASTTAQATIDAILASEPRPVGNIHTPPGGPSTPSSLSRNGGTNTPETSDKVYCTHWIRHGECDYIQQGCRYKHEMPNKATLQSIGFRTVPRWWQEKVAVQLGQSAIPIVGDGLRPSEWMKLKKRSSDSGESSSSDDDSESDCEFDESEAESEAGSEVEDKGDNEEKPNSPANIVKEICLTPATKPMMKDQAKTSTLPSTIKTSPGAVPITEKLRAPLITSIKAIRKPSLAGSDLIDLSHADSTREIFPAFRSSCPPSSTSSTTTLTHESNPQEGKSAPTISAPALAASQTENKQLPTLSPSPPRKIFVPAGESKEYHIAHARRSNAVVPSIEVPAVKFTLGGGHAKEVAAAAAKQAKHHQQQRQQAKNTSAAKKRPTLANFASGKGLMASVHAPMNVYVAGNLTSTPTAPPPSPTVVLSPTSVKQQQQRKHLLQQAKKSNKSGHQQQRGSRSASSSSSYYHSPTLPGNSSNLSLKTSEIVAMANVKKSEEVKPASKGTRPVIPDACQPRRPAGQVGKEAHPRSKQTALKVAGGAMKV